MGDPHTSLVPDQRDGSAHRASAYGQGAAGTIKQRDVWSLDEIARRDENPSAWLLPPPQLSTAVVASGVDMLRVSQESSRRFQVRSVLLCELICQRPGPCLLSSTDSCDIRPRECLVAGSLACFRRRSVLIGFE